MATTFKSLQDISSFYSGGSASYTGDYIITANGENVNITPTRPAQRRGLKARLVKGDGDIVTAIAVQNNILVVASRSLQISIYDMATPSLDLLHRFRTYHQAPIVSMVIHSSSHLLATGSADSMVRIFDLRTKSCSHVFKTSSLVSALSFFDKDQKWIVCAGCEDGRLYVWDLVDKQVLLSTAAHSTVIRSISFDGSSWVFLTAARDSTVSFWDMQIILGDGDEPKLDTFVVYEPVEYCTFIDPKLFNETSQIFYTAGEKGQVRVWRREGMHVIKAYPENTSDVILHPIVHAIFNSTTNTILIIDSHQNISILSLPSLELVETRIGTFDEITDIKFIGPNGRWLLTGSTSERLLLIDLGLAGSAQQVSHEWGNITSLTGHSSAILSVDGDCGKPIDDHQSLIYLFASGSKDNSAKLWAMESDGVSMSVKCLGDFVGHVDEVTSVVLSNGSPSKTLAEALKRFLITASNDRTVKKWNLSQLGVEGKKPTSEWTIKAHEKDINAVANSTDNQKIATCSQDRTVKIWNSETGELLGTLNGHKRSVWHVKFAPGDRYVASASGDKTVKLWNPVDFTCVRTFESHTNSVLRIDFIKSSFLADSKNQIMVSSGSDGLTKIWAIASSDCVQTLDNHEDKVWALAIRDSNLNDSSKDMEVGGEEDVDLTSGSLWNKCLIATGAGDSKISLSVDVTEETLEKMQAEEELKILQEQELSNYLQRKDFLGALQTALRLKLGKKMAEILQMVLLNRIDATKSSFSIEIDNWLSELSLQDLTSVLTFVKDWNTQSKWSQIAQNCLHLIVKSKKPSEILQVPGINDLLGSMIMYTERHYQRIDEQLTSSFILDFTLAQINNNLDNLNEIVGK